MHTLLQDLKFGVRLLAKAPAFTLVAALSLALGIGANTTIFTLINAVLLNPLPVADPAQLVSVFTSDERNQNGGLGNFLQLSPMNYKDLRDQNAVFSGLAAHTGLPLNISGGKGEAGAGLRRNRHRQLLRRAWREAARSAAASDRTRTRIPARRS